jgi:TctA family transporter
MFFGRPIALVIIAFTILSLCYPLITKLRNKKKEKGVPS